MRENPARPPKKWMRSCVENVRASGTAKDPRGVCGSLWFHKMGKEEKRRALRREDRGMSANPERTLARDLKQEVLDFLAELSLDDVERRRGGGNKLATVRHAARQVLQGDMSGAKTIQREATRISYYTIGCRVLACPGRSRHRPTVGEAITIAELIEQTPDYRVEAYRKAEYGVDESTAEIMDSRYGRGNWDMPMSANPERDWWGPGERWLEQEALKEYRAQRAAHIKRGRSPNTFRYSPPDWQRDAVDALGKNDEERFKAIKLDRIGYPTLLSNPTSGQVAAVVAGVAVLGLAAWWLFRPKTAQAASLPAACTPANTQQLYDHLGQFATERGYAIFYDEVTTDITKKGPPTNPKYIAAGSSAREWDTQLCGFYKWTGTQWVKDDATNKEFNDWTAAQILKQTKPAPSPAASPSPTPTPAANPNTAQASIPCPVTSEQLQAFATAQGYKVFTNTQGLVQATTAAPYTTDPTWRMFLFATCSFYAWQVNEWVHDLPVDAEFATWAATQGFKLPSHYVHGAPDPASTFMM